MYASIVIYPRRERQWAPRDRIAGRPCASARHSVRGLLCIAALLSATAVEAQWRVTSPAAAAAWYQAVDSLHLAGDGALALTRSRGAPTSALGHALSAPRFDLLHFVPLYYPSATRAALADAMFDAAGIEPPRAARAQFLVGAIRRALPDARDRQRLVELAELARRVSLTAVTPDRLNDWQESWARRFAPALAPFLAHERLDAGVLFVIPALGPEGRLFAGVPGDRADNIVAVAAPETLDASDAPLYAFVRELCFPLVSRTADALPFFRRTAGSPREAARRASIAAVRCGAELLDRVLPAESPRYRAHWQRASGTPDTAFDTLYPPDPLLTPPLRTALQRYTPRP